MVIPDASAERRQSVRKGSTRVISGLSAAQPYHSPSRWMPSIVGFSRARLSLLRSVVSSVATLPQLPSTSPRKLAVAWRDERTDPAKLAIIAQIRRLGDNFSALQHRLSVVRIRALRLRF